MRKRVADYGLALPARLSSMYRVAQAAAPFQLGWGLLGYYLLLVLVTDCLIWYSSGSLSGYRWQYLIVYSLLSYPLWMLIALKGVGREQSDLSEMGKWHAIDLLPGGSTSIFLGQFIGKTLKTKALIAWLIAFLILSAVNGSGVLMIFLALCNLALGAVNLVLGGIWTRMHAPKGYSNVISSIFSNLTWILSGAVFPLGMLSQSPLFYLLNPFSAAVSTPLSLLEEPGASALDPFLVQVYTLCGALVWMTILCVACWRAERSQREKFYQ